MSDQPAAVSPRLLRNWPLPEADDGGSKHDRGTVTIVGGADSTPGAVLLAGLAALRVGAGRLQVVTVEATAVGLGVALPEAMVVGVPAGPGGSIDPSAAGKIVELCEGAGAVVLGPGLLGKDACRELMAGVLPGLTDTAVVLDAVALTALAGHPGLLDPVRKRTVLTPNAGELAALLEGEEQSGREGAAAVASSYDVVVALRGWVVRPDGEAWLSEAGGVGLGTSGSGDVLAGAVGGLLARGADAGQAAVWGQYLHAAAGDRLATRIGRTGFLARELLDEIPVVLSSLRA